MIEKYFEQEDLPFDLEKMVGSAFLEVMFSMNEKELDELLEVIEKAGKRIRGEEEPKAVKEEARVEPAKTEDNEDVDACQAFFEFLSSLGWDDDEDEKPEETEEDEDECCCDEDCEEEEMTLEVDKINYTRNNMVVTWLDGTKTHVTNLFDGAYSPWNAFCSAVAERVYGSKEHAMDQLEYGLDRGDK